MKRFNKLGFAAALLAGSALSVTTVYAQEASDPTKPRLQQNEKAPSAKSEAPGQKKLEGQAATEMAPGPTAVSTKPATGSRNSSSLSCQMSGGTAEMANGISRP